MRDRISSLPLLVAEWRKQGWRWRREGKVGRSVGREIENEAHVDNLVATESVVCRSGTPMKGVGLLIRNLKKDQTVALLFQFRTSRLKLDPGRRTLRCRPKLPSRSPSGGFPSLIGANQIDGIL